MDFQMNLKSGCQHHFTALLTLGLRYFKTFNYKLSERNFKILSYVQISYLNQMTDAAYVP